MPPLYILLDVASFEQNKSDFLTNLARRTNIYRIIICMYIIKYYVDAFMDTITVVRITI